MCMKFIKNINSKLHWLNKDGNFQISYNVLFPNTISPSPSIYVQTNEMSKKDIYIKGKSKIDNMSIESML